MRNIVLMAINANFFTRVGEYRESSAIRIVNRSIRLNAGQEYQRRNFARQGSAPSGRNVEAVIMGKIVSMLMDKKVYHCFSSFYCYSFLLF